MSLHRKWARATLASRRLVDQIRSDSARRADWPQLLALYELLEEFGPNQVVSLNRAVAVAMVHGPAAGLDLVTVLETDKRMARHHRRPAFLCNGCSSA